MRYLVGFVHIAVLVGLTHLSACAAEGGGLGQWVTGKEAERLCQAWCNPEMTCVSPGYATGERCRPDCKYTLAGPCGRYWATQYDCRLGLNCPDEFGDCESALFGIPFGYQQCAKEISDTCDSCPPGTALYDVCDEEPPVCGYSECTFREEACFESGGDCNADYVTEMCKRRNRAGNPDCSGIYSCGMFPC